jgi:hypothetical protein
MATLYGNTVWEGLSIEDFPSYEEGARDGHYIKLLDSGESYIRVEGEWEYINLGLAFIKATKSGKITTDATGHYSVSFNTPFINYEYTVALSIKYPGDKIARLATFDNVNTNGFDIIVTDAKGDPITNTEVVSWLATRNYNP